MGIPRKQGTNIRAGNRTIFGTTSVCHDFVCSIFCRQQIEAFSIGGFFFCGAVDFRGLCSRPIFDCRKSGSFFFNKDLLWRVNYIGVVLICTRFNTFLCEILGTFPPQPPLEAVLAKTVHMLQESKLASSTCYTPFKLCDALVPSKCAALEHYIQMRLKPINRDIHCAAH